MITTMELILLMTLVFCIGGGFGWYLCKQRDDKILKELIDEQERTYLEACDDLKECIRSKFDDEETYQAISKRRNNAVKYEFTLLKGLKTARTSIY